MNSSPLLDHFITLSPAKMREGSIREDEAAVLKLHFLHLPPEIHGHVIRYCGVKDIYSLALVNHFLNNVVRSKLRDFLIAGCQNGKL